MRRLVGPFGGGVAPGAGAGGADGADLESILCPASQPRDCATRGLAGIALGSGSLHAAPDGILAHRSTGPFPQGEGRARHSVRAVARMETPRVRPVLAFRGAHGVTRPTTRHTEWRAAEARGCGGARVC